MTFQFEPHKKDFSKVLSKAVCAKCGLVYLNNRLSKFAVRHGCNNEDHPAYLAQRNRAGKHLND